MANRQQDENELNKDRQNAAGSNQQNPGNKQSAGNSPGGRSQYSADADEDSHESGGVSAAGSQGQSGNKADKNAQDRNSQQGNNTQGGKSAPGSGGTADKDAQRRSGQNNPGGSNR